MENNDGTQENITTDEEKSEVLNSYFKFTVENKSQIPEPTQHSLPVGLLCIRQAGDKCRCGIKPIERFKNKPTGPDKIHPT